MAQLDPDRYLRLSSAFTYGQDDGLFWDRTNTQLVLVLGDSVVARIDTTGVTADLEYSGEARGDLLRRGASSWEALSAKTTGQLLIGNGTDVISAPVTGDVTATHSAGNLATAVTDLTITSEAQGDVLVRGASAWQRLAAKSAGQVLIGNGTDIISAAISGDLNALSAAGVATLEKSLIKTRKMSFTSALVKDHTTPLVLLDHSAMVTAGLCAVGDAIIFHGAILQVSGGAANYDTNNTIIAKYQTAGGGATASLTLTNWLNGRAPDALTTLKPLATDIAPEVDQDIVLVESASPYTAAGDRLLKAWAYYSIYTPS